MNQRFFEMISDPSSNIPSYFSDPETQEILYFNQPMKLLMQITNDKEYLGKNCQEFFAETKKEEEESRYQKAEVAKDQITVFHFHCAKINAYVTSYVTLLSHKGKTLQFNKFFETDAKYHLLENMSFQTAMIKVVEILSQGQKEDQINRFLDLLGEYYQGSRCFFYQMNPRTDEVKEVFSWDSDTAPKILDQTIQANHNHAFLSWAATGLPWEILNFDFHSDKTKNLPPETIEHYTKNNYLNLSICPSFSKDRQLKSVLGILNRTRQMEESGQSFLKVVAQFLDTSLIALSGEGDESQYLDQLTGALNRGKYNTALQNLKFEAPQDIGVIFINANGLKKTNQYYGLEAGDKLIQDSMSLAKNTFDFPWYRLSGDEFICFVTESQEETFKKKLSNLHEELAQMPQRLFALGSAWGNRTNDMDKLIETADAMMYIDKQTYYTDFDPTKIEFSDHVLQDLLLAIQEEEFLVYLQPKVSLATEKVVGAEALIRRFSKAQNKMIFPDQFIPLYEKKSIIRHVDLFVLRKVCQLLKEWNQLGEKLTVSVNLSRVTLLEHGIVHKFADICDDYAIEHSQIVVEVTERVGLIENEMESPLIEQFKQYGFTISLDDFGCAYSNIVTLATISVDEVKIDKSLVDNILTNKKNKSIVENMIRMVDSFGQTSTLAEGVESQEQADCLRECHCQYVQGYFYSRPIPTDEFFQKYIAN
ncbi:MAG: GGDEF domain-containing phosphodiesterase [Eubacteriales bacterium]